MDDWTSTSWQLVGLTALIPVVAARALLLHADAVTAGAENVDLGLVPR